MQEQFKTTKEKLFAMGLSKTKNQSITDKVVRGTNIVPGRGKDQSAYRGEMGGILGSILTAKILCDKYEVKKDP